MNIISVVSSRIDLDIDEIRRKTNSSIEKNVEAKIAEAVEESKNIAKKIEEAANIGLNEITAKVSIKNAFFIKEIFNDKGFETTITESLTVKTPSGNCYTNIKIAW